jgi:eukaryotic-like serine/threonine-protein kinase
VQRTYRTHFCRLLGLAVAAFMFNAAPATDMASVATFRGDAVRSGVYADAGSGVFGGVLWRNRTGSAVRSTPTLIGSRLLIGSSDGMLYALDARDGQEQWRFAADSPIASSATVADGRVFISSYRGGFYALDLKDGRLLWKARFGATLPAAFEQQTGAHLVGFNGDFILSSAAVDHGTVIVGGGDGLIHAFEAATGKPKWSFHTDGRIRSSPSISDGIAYVGSWDGTLYALSTEGGKLIWRFDTKGRTLNSAEFGFDRRSILSSPAVVAGTVYVGSRDAFLYALDARSGALKWSYDYEKESMTWVVGSPAVCDGVVYAATSDGHFVHALQATDGKELWRATVSSGVFWSSPAVAGSTLYVTNQSGALYAIDRASGKERWRFQTPSGLQSSAVIADGVAYFGSNDGTVYAVRVDGEQPMQRAVYWDAESAKLSPTTDYAAVRDFFQKRDYAVLDSATLTDWLSRRSLEAGASVIVFATDILPAAAGGADPGHGPFRRYLEHGGKALWLGDPPLLDKIISDNNVTLDWASANALLGVHLQGALQDLGMSNHSTQAGLSWGLSPAWLGAWDVPPSNDITVLALDDRDFAGAWVRSYGGAPGTGFVFLPLPSWDAAALANVAMIAEYRPRQFPKLSAGAGLLPDVLSEQRHSAFGARSPGVSEIEAYRLREFATSGEHRSRCDADAVLECALL